MNLTIVNKNNKQTEKNKYFIAVGRSDHFFPSDIFLKFYGNFEKKLEKKKFEFFCNFHL